MTDLVNAYLQRHANIVRGIPRPVKAMQCADGFAMSVQASSMHYCLPYADNAFPYTHFEIGPPCKATPEFEAYSVSSDIPIYARVPLDVILAVIAVHGGLVEPDA